MQKSTSAKKEEHTLKSFPIALVVGEFNVDICESLLDGTVSQLKKCGVTAEDIYIYRVPGAIEIPLVCKRLAMSGAVKSIIALGSVIRGDTSHYDLVCNAVNQGCMQISLEFNLPVIFGVLTTETEKQAWDRLGGKYGHKGVELANTALSLHQLLDELPK